MKPGSLRFFLALTVVFYHISQYVFIGYFAVHCFFILSGYWISIMYDQKYANIKDTLRVYYISRYWRLLPVFLLIVVAIYVQRSLTEPFFYQAYAGLSFVEKTIYIVSNCIILGYNQLSKSVTLLTPAWSLDIEIQFYVLFPLIRFLIKKNTSLIVLLGLSIIVTSYLSVFLNGSIISKTVIYYLPYFLSGIVLSRFPNNFSKRSSQLSAFLFITILAIHYVIPSLMNITVFDKASNYNRVLNEILPLFIIPFIGRTVNLQSSKIDKELGNMAYVLYFCHWFWLIPYAQVVFGMDGMIKTIYAGLYIVVIFVSTYLIYKYYDKPIDNMRRNWVARQEEI